VVAGSRTRLGVLSSAARSIHRRGRQLPRAGCLVPGPTAVRPLRTWRPFRAEGLPLVFARLYELNFTGFSFGSFIGPLFENRLSCFFRTDAFRRLSRQWNHAFLTSMYPIPYTLIFFMPVASFNAHYPHLRAVTSPQPGPWSSRGSSPYRQERQLSDVVSCPRPPPALLGRKLLLAPERSQQRPISHERKLSTSRRPERPARRPEGLPRASRRLAQLILASSMEQVERDDDL
jgi:hypothetical protein